MRLSLAGLLLVFSSAYVYGAPITADLSGVKSGPIAVVSSTESVKVSWSDAANHQWQTVFSLDSAQPLITSISVDGNTIVDRARPYYRCTTGKRTGGWDAFFDFPPANPAGTRQFMQEFHPAHVVAKTVGNRVEVNFDGMKVGIFSGSLRYTFYPGTPLIQQAAILSTQEPDTAYYYDAGLEMTADQDISAGRNMASKISYFDLDGKLQEMTPPYESDRRSLAAHYRTIAAKMGTGSIAVFPPPHRYFFARDYTTNQGYLWYSSWRGRVGLGVHQYPDDDTTIDPWMNAPPATEQEMSLFLMPGAGDSRTTLKDVLSFTHNDRYAHLDGFVTFEPHWHLAYTVQAMEKGIGWVPPFKPAMQNVGIDSAMIMDFHGDGHPAALTGIRPHELDQYYKACRAQSDSHFLLIPSEEADIYLGGHWGLVFPHPVYWYQDRKSNESFEAADPKYGKVYRVHDADEMWKMIKLEDGVVYETHPRTKGSTGYPDKILDTHYFRDSSYIGTGWKAMPSDLSSPRLGERAFKTIDELNNLGLHKLMIGEVDVFQTSVADELYAHMNINYLRMPELPSFDHYDRILKSVEKGDGFITTGEILLPSATTISPMGDHTVQVKTKISSTFPLRIAEVVWGDGKNIHHQIIDLQSTPAFDDHEYSWVFETPGWIWARFAVWDIAGDGAFTNPTWHDRM